MLATPPLPPSPSTLARPLADPSLIDPELFSSLCIIWGRHDPKGESIKLDLCSPVGYGVHAKAFYFLLGKYRDETSRFAEVEASTGDLAGVTFNLGWELDTGIGAGITQKHEGNRALRSRALTNLVAPSAPHPPASAPIPVSGLAPPIMTRSLTSTSRDRPPSPGGPRSQPTAEQQRYRQQQNYNEPARPGFTASRGGAGGPRPPQPKRGYTYSHPVSYIQHLPVSNQHTSAPEHRVQRTNSNRAVQRPQRHRSIQEHAPHPHEAEKTRHNSKAPFAMHVPSSHSPQSAPSAPMSPTISDNVDNQLPLVSVPATENPALQKTMNDIADRVNELVLADGPAGREPSTQDVARRAVSRPGGNMDKENQGDESWSYVGEDEGRSTLLGVGRDIGKEVGNIIPNDVSKGKKDNKERKTKRTSSFK